MELDKIITGDSAVVLQSFPPDCIDLTVTSPPYDNLRTYNGFVFDFETIAKQLFRVTKAGGVVVWVVGDSVENGGVTLTSFIQALAFKEVGFTVHQVMIYEKTGHPFPPSNRYYQQTEYMFILSKGTPKTTNLLREKVTYKNKRNLQPLTRQADGSMERMKYKIGNDDRVKDNIWRYATGGGLSATDDYGHKHPAIFPEDLARDHILSWSNEGDIVLDCFTGSGTTLKMAKMLNRHYLGIEISPEYVTLAEKRVLATPVPLFGQGRGLTLPAPDGGDSAASEQLSTPEVLSTLQGESNPAHRK